MVRYNQYAPPAGFKRVNRAGGGRSYEEIMRMADEAKANKVIDKLIKSNRINNYIPASWNFESKQVQDKLSIFSSSYTVEKPLLKEALMSSAGLLEALQYNIKKCCYIIRQSGSFKTVAFFYGDENAAFTKVMERKALFFSNVPHIINGRICGKVSLSEILSVALDYDRDYGLHLKKLFNEGKIEGEYHLGKTTQFRT